MLLRTINHRILWQLKIFNYRQIYQFCSTYIVMITQSRSLITKLHVREIRIMHNDFHNLKAVLLDNRITINEGIQKTVR